jgi:hypothetical protein
VSSLAVFFIAALVGISASGAGLAQQQAYVNAVKPTASELTWQKIPWELDLDKGYRDATRENRPLLLWTTGDDPLERC